jgi:integrase
MEKKKTQSSRANQFYFFKQPGSKFYSVRLMVDGRRRRFTTGETTQPKAKSKAIAIMADIKSRGFEAAIRLHGNRRDEIPEDPTIDKFCEIYRKVVSTADSPPAAVTVERYVRCLKRICEQSKVGRIRALDSAAVERFKEKFIHSALPPQGIDVPKKRAAKSIPPKKTRDANSVRTTLNGVIRNAAALFSQSAMAAYRNRGLDLQNPFAGTKMKRVTIKSHTPFPRELLDAIWKNSPELRDGNPKAKKCDPSKGRRSAEAINFRVPHPDAYAIFLLELGLGLRRNEADKAEWAWVYEAPDGRRFLQVRETDLFIPKSKNSRIIPIDPVIWDLLLAMKKDERFIVESPKAKPKRSSVNTSVVYRCEEAHRVLVVWLRKMGVDDPKPCHALRKEFGSYVATNFSLFHAQKLLGHSNPAVTSAYYASLTDLPNLQPSRMGKSKP